MTGLSGLDGRIVDYLAAHPRSRPTTIAAALGKTIGHVWARLQLLEGQGVVCRADRGIWKLKANKDIKRMKSEE